MFEVVEFPSEGATLRGRFYRPVHVAPWPAVVMTHGTTATITMCLDRYAEVFCRAGLAVLLYDHRNFGLSGGEPRQLINPWLQARGYSDAMNYLLTRGDVHTDRIAAWGDSYSGMIALAVGALPAICGRRGAMSRLWHRNAQARAERSAFPDNASDLRRRRHHWHA